MNQGAAQSCPSLLLSLQTDKCAEIYPPDDKDLSFSFVVNSSFKIGATWLVYLCIGQRWTYLADFAVCADRAPVVFDVVIVMIAIFVVVIIIIVIIMIAIFVVIIIITIIMIVVIIITIVVIVAVIIITIVIIVLIIITIVVIIIVGVVVVIVVVVCKYGQRTAHNLLVINSNAGGFPSC